MIYLDSCMLIYATENRESQGLQARMALSSASGHSLAISSLVKLECLVKPIRNDNFTLIQLYEEAFADLEVLQFSEDTFMRAAELRARFGLKTPDALHLAVAQLHRCSAFWTNDHRLAAASQGLAQKVI